MRSSPAGAGCKGRASWPNAPSIPRVPAFTAARRPTGPHTSSPRMRSLLAPSCPTRPRPSACALPHPHPDSETRSWREGAAPAPTQQHPPGGCARLCPAGRPGQRPRERTVLASSNYHADRHAAWKITEGPGKQRRGRRAGGRLPSLKPSRLPQQHQVTTGGIWNLRDDLEEGRAGL